MRTQPISKTSSESLAQPMKCVHRCEKEDYYYYVVLLFHLGAGRNSIVRFLHIRKNLHTFTTKSESTKNLNGANSDDDQTDGF